MNLDQERRKDWGLLRRLFDRWRHTNCPSHQPLFVQGDTIYTLTLPPERSYDTTEITEQDGWTVVVIYTEDREA